MPPIAHIDCQATLPKSAPALCLSRNRCHRSHSLSRWVRFAAGPAQLKGLAVLDQGQPEHPEPCRKKEPCSIWNVKVPPFRAT